MRRKEGRKDKILKLVGQLAEIIDVFIKAQLVSLQNVLYNFNSNLNVTLR